MASSQPNLNPLRIRFADFELDEANASLSRRGEAVALPPTPFALLCALARQPDTLLKKDTLLDSVWGHQFVSESVLKTAISDLRNVLGDNPRQPRFIETVSRRGYRFIGAISHAPSLAGTPAANPDPDARVAPAFIGRATSLARLNRAWERVQGGQRALVWIAGEPGIGKTTLIEQFITGVSGAVCAHGHCVEHFGTGEPYLPVLEALADLCRKDPALPELLRTVAPTWLLQLPWLCDASERDALRRELAGVGPERMLREMGELLERYTEQRPLLLVTEDLHWSDRATVQLIDYIARRRGRIRLMWLASFRVTEVVALDHPLGSLRHELRLQRLCEEMVLDPFSETEVAEYITLGSSSLARDETFVRAMHERTDGVPLFVSAVMDEVINQATDTSRIKACLAKVAVPQSLATIIDHYISRLSPEQHDLLCAAAVCGIDFRLETVSLVLEHDLATLANACEQLIRGQQWLKRSRVFDHEDEATDQHYSFRHALFRQVMYERTPPLVRVRLHCQAGAALERERSAGMPVPATELAMHFDRARQPMIALRYYTEAMEAALLHFSPSSTDGLSQRATALLRQAVEGTERNALEISIATLQGVSAFQLSGVGNETANAFKRAYALLAHSPDHSMRGRLLHGYGYTLCLRGEYAQALAVAEHAEALAAQSGDPQLVLAACIVYSEVFHLQGRSQACCEWIERGLAIAENLEIGPNEIFAADPLVTLLGMRAVEWMRSGLFVQARDCMLRAQARAGMLRQPMTRLVACWNDVLIAIRMGNTERVAALTGAMQMLVDEYSLALGRTACRWWRGWTDARNGSPRDGHRHIREAFEEHAGLGMQSGSSEVLGYAVEALLLAGDLEAAQVELEEALRMADELGERVYLPQLMLLKAAIARAKGQTTIRDIAMRCAVQEARAQEAPWLELIALVELCDQRDACAEDRQALARLIDQLPEAEDTLHVKRARSLLLPVAVTGCSLSMATA